MTKTHDIKSTFALIFPLMAAFLAQKSMQLIDTLMMGWIGPSALAAGAVGTAIYMTTLVFCMGTLSAVGVFIARAKGANDKDDVRLSLQHGILMALLLSVPCIGLIWAAPHVLIVVEDPAVVHNAALLLHGLSLGLPGYLLFLVFREFISAFALTRIVMIVTISSIPLTFSLNYILIYGKFGFPALGVAGIGYASAFVMWLMFIELLLYSLWQVKLKEYLHFTSFKFNMIKMRDIFFIGFPSGTYFVLESAMFMSAALMTGYFGVDALAAYQIAMQCAIVSYAIPFSLAMATALQVGNAMGANESYRLKTIAVQSFSIGIAFSSIVAGLYIFFPEFFINLFLSNNNHVDTIKMADSFLFIGAFFQCFDAIQAIANGMLRGLKDTFIPMILSVLCYWVIGMLSAYYLAFHTSLGPKGIWYGITFSICSLGFVLMIRMAKKVKKYSP